MFIHYMYVDILFPLTKTIPIMFERVTTHNQTLWTWIGHNAMRYHNFHALPYIFSQCNIGQNGMHYHNFKTLPHALPYISYQFGMVWGLFATGYHALPSNL